ncbi:hypothetical protein ABT095_01785 [Kitasatospora sp. NPDC002227]|uniref:hypothetical protein n=1 Tax=Kitasatospora sp. NPDC002227 TaxID=3154773 RepID=UPI00332BEA46
MTRTAVARHTLATSPFKAPEVAPIETYEVGDRVSHDRHGLGRVVAVEGTAAVICSFGDQRLRCSSPFVKLVKL